MFGIGMPEMILILALALIVIGPKKLPDLAKSLGRAFREFRKATSELKDSMGIDNELQEVKKSFDEINSDIKDSVDVSRVFEDENDETVSTSEENAEKPATTKSPGKLESLKTAFDDDELDPEKKALFTPSDEVEASASADADAPDSSPKSSPENPEDGLAPKEKGESDS